MRKPLNDSDIIYDAINAIKNLHPNIEGEFSYLGVFDSGDLYSLSVTINRVLGHLTAQPETDVAIEFQRSKGIQHGYLKMRLDSNGIPVTKFKVKNVYELSRYFDFSDFDLDSFTQKCL